MNRVLINIQRAQLQNRTLAFEQRKFERYTQIGLYGLPKRDGGGQKKLKVKRSRILDSPVKKQEDQYWQSLAHQIGSYLLNLNGEKADQDANQSASPTKTITLAKKRKLHLKVLKKDHSKLDLSHQSGADQLEQADQFEMIIGQLKSFGIHPPDAEFIPEFSQMVKLMQKGLNITLANEKRRKSQDGRDERNSDSEDDVHF